MNQSLGWVIPFFLAAACVGCQNTDRKSADSVVTPTATTASSSAIAVQDGSGSFIFAGTAGHSIEVFYHKPVAFDPSTSPILIVVPGAGRNGDDYRDAWIQPSEEHGVLILAPAYPEDQYDVAAYHMGGVVKDLELRNLERSHHGSVFRLRDEDIVFTPNIVPEKWIFRDFDRLFDAVVSAVGSDQMGYDLFGHSAGGQILHRMALYHPDSKAMRLLASNSGFYTVPTPSVSFPLGIKETPLAADHLKRAFAENLILFLGENDNETETRGRHLRTPNADAQGIGRFARGTYFYEQGEAISKDLGAEFAWKLEVVPGVGHDYRAMGEAAARYLYDRPQASLN